MKTPDDLGVLLLHGLPLDRRMWEHQLHVLPSSTVAPNLYDFGRDIEQWAKKCLGLMLQDRFIVVGCSVGGSCALEVAKLATDRVAAAILIGTKARCDPDPVAHSEACKIVRDQGVAGAWEHYWKPHFQAEGGAGTAERAEEIALDQSVLDLAQGLNAFYTRKCREDVVLQSKAPIHVVTSDRDALPGLSYSQRLAGLSDNACLHVIEDCGHYVPMMQPMVLNRLILDVIKDANTERRC